MSEEQAEQQQVVDDEEGDEEEEATTDRKWMKLYNLTQEQMNEIKEVFAMFDVNSDGVISSSDFGTSLRAMGQNPSNADIQKMLGECDVHENGTISLEAYVATLGKRGIRGSVEMQEELEEALKVFDKLGAGCIEASELKQILLTQGEPIDEDDVNELMKTAGVDADGKMNYYDFITQMCEK